MSSNQLQNSGDTSDGDDSPNWDGYSDYQYVSYQIASSIEDAIDQFSTLQALHDQNAKIKPRDAAEARRPILSAAMRLVHELEKNKDGNELYARMVDDWTESGVDDERGYIEALRAVDLQNQCPDWLYEFVLDLRRAGWELGYLQAGRYEEDEENDAEADAREMLEDILQAK